MSATQPNLDSQLSNAEVASAVPRGQLWPALPCSWAHPAPSLLASSCFYLHGPSVTAFLLRRELTQLTSPSQQAAPAEAREWDVRWSLEEAGVPCTGVSPAMPLLHSMWRRPSTRSKPRPYGALWSARGQGGERSPLKLTLSRDPPPAFRHSNLNTLLQLDPCYPKA